jgi:penicillin V acylase-like amidase (Ntn superfamily)
MIDAKDAVVWTNSDTKQVKVLTHAWPRGAAWGDPIGAAYTQWNKMTDKQRVELMLETAIDLAMQGYSLKDVLTEFAQVRQFRALGEKSFPMCRALTKALVGRSLEFNTMSFEELLVQYAKEKVL